MESSDATVAGGSFFDKLDTVQSEVLTMKKIGVLAETMEVNDLSSQYASIIFFVLGILFSIVLFIVLQVVGVQYSYPTLFCWWDTYYQSSAKRPACRTQQATGLVPDVTPTMLALSYSYPAVFRVLNALTILPDVPPQAAAFLLLGVEQKGQLITPIHWRGTEDELGYNKLAGMWLPADYHAVSATAKSLVAIWQTCRGAWEDVANNHDLDPRHLPTVECVQRDLDRVFAGLGPFALRTNLDICVQWADWLVDGCPPGGRELYPYLPWNEVLHPPTYDPDDVNKTNPRLSGSYGWPIGWANSMCENPFYAWVPLLTDKAPDSSKFVELASIFMWCTQTTMNGAFTPTARDSPLGILYSSGLVGLALSTVGTNTRTTATDFYDYMFSPNTGLMTNKVKADCVNASNLDGVSAGLSTTIGMSFLPAGEMFKYLNNRTPKMVDSWDKSLRSMGVTDEQLGKSVVRGGRDEGWFSKLTRGRRTLAEEFANSPWSVAGDKLLNEAEARRTGMLGKRLGWINDARDWAYGTDTQLSRAMTSLKQAGVVTRDVAQTSRDLAEGARAASKAVEGIEDVAKTCDWVMIGVSGIMGGVVGALTAIAEKNYCAQFNDNDAPTYQAHAKCVRTDSTPIWLQCVCVDSPECCKKYGEPSYLDKIEANLCEPDRTQTQQATLDARRQLRESVRRATNRYDAEVRARRRLGSPSCQRWCVKCTQDELKHCKPCTENKDCGDVSCKPWTSGKNQCSAAPTDCFQPTPPTESPAWVQPTWS